MTRSARKKVSPELIKNNHLPVERHFTLLGSWSHLLWLA
jgi:hypothetical protein